MNNEAAQFLEKLGALSWFANCGKPLKGDYVQVESLKQAHKYYADPRGMGWENSKLAVMNQQGLLIWDVTHHIREELQKAARETMKAVADFFDQNRQRIFSRLPEDKYVTRMVRMDIGWIVGEVEDQHLPVMRDLLFFSTRLLPIYLAGHLPCGWSGKRIPRGWAGTSLADLPEGKIIVF
jgi:hypothetical protein